MATVKKLRRMDGGWRVHWLTATGWVLGKKLATRQLATDYAKTYMRRSAEFEDFKVLPAER